MKVSSKSWHFKLAQYGGMKHFYGLPYPTTCKYIAYIFCGVFWGIIEKFLFRWVLPLLIDLGLGFCFYLLITFQIDDPKMAFTAILSLCIYFGAVVITLIDEDVYYGPLFILRRFTVVTQFINKFCGKVEIVYEKE